MHASFLYPSPLPRTYDLSVWLDRGRRQKGGNTCTYFQRMRFLLSIPPPFSKKEFSKTWVRVKGRSPSPPIGFKANRRTSLLRLVFKEISRRGAKNSTEDIERGERFEIIRTPRKQFFPSALYSRRDTPYHPPIGDSSSLKRPISSFHKAGDKVLGVRLVCRRLLFCRRSIDGESGGKQRLLFFSAEWCRTPWRMDGASFVGNLWPGTVQ